MADTQGTRWRQIKVNDRLGTGPKGQSVDQTLTGATVAAYASDGITLTTGAVPISTVGAGTAIGTWIQETPSGAMDGSNKVFTVSHTPLIGTLSVYLNGVFQDPFWISHSGTTITYVAAPTAADQMYAEYEY